MLTCAPILTKLPTRPMKSTALRDRIFKKRERGAVVKCADYGGVGGVEGEADALDRAVGGHGGGALFVLVDAPAFHRGRPLGRRPRHRLLPRPQARTGSRREPRLERAALVPPRHLRHPRA